MSTHIPEQEPPNRATQEEIHAIYPSTAPYGGEERFSRQLFSDIGGTIKDFGTASKVVAQVHKNI